MIEEAGYDKFLLAAEQLVWLRLITPVDTLGILVLLLVDVVELILGGGVESLIESFVSN